MHVNLDIAITHVVTRKRQSGVAILGVAIGIAVFLFMNSLSSGFTRYSRSEIFKQNAHIRIFREASISEPLLDTSSAGSSVIIVNPRITEEGTSLLDPDRLRYEVGRHNKVTYAIKEVGVDVFYVRGKTEIPGLSTGVQIMAYDSMFNLKKYMVAGELSSLDKQLDGIIIGSGIARKLNLQLDGSILVRSSRGVGKYMRVTGIFTTGSKASDDAKSYINIRAAQQLLKEGPSFIKSILVMTPDPDKTEDVVKHISELTSFKVQDWKTANADFLAGDKTRGTLMTSISVSILVVAAFGIFNILSSTITQKINDIAILKAVGFSGKDVVIIFVTEAMIMGVVGTMLGLALGAILIKIISGVYMGGPVGYFPITFELNLFLISMLLGWIITFFAGFFPALRAAHIDPVEIFRR
jgi:lipoprotein-releasing system permease protein